MDLFEVTNIKVECTRILAIIALSSTNEINKNDFAWHLSFFVFFVYYLQNFLQKLKRMCNKFQGYISNYYNVTIGLKSRRYIQNFNIFNVIMINGSLQNVFENLRYTNKTLFFIFLKYFTTQILSLYLIKYSVIRKSLSWKQVWVCHN